MFSRLTLKAGMKSISFNEHLHYSPLPDFHSPLCPLGEECFIHAFPFTRDVSTLVSFEAGNLSRSQVKLGGGNSIFGHICLILFPGVYITGTQGSDRGVHLGIIICATDVELIISAGLKENVCSIRMKLPDVQSEAVKQ